MKRVVLAGAVGALAAVLAFAVVVALTDVRVTTANNVTTTASLGGTEIAGRTPPPCSRGASLITGFHQPQEAAGALMIPVSISLAKGTPCTLDADVHFEIQSLNVPGTIHGNPQTWSVQSVLNEETGPSSIFVWRNYCGPGEARFAFKLRVEGNHGSAKLFEKNRKPSCEAPGSGAQSTLDRLPISG